MSGPKDQKSIISKYRSTNKKSTAQKYILQAKKRKEMNGTGLLKLLDFSSSVEKSFCATNFKVTEFWESFGTSLLEEISARQAAKSGFNDKELTYALFYCTHAGAALSDNGLCHNEITPEFISVFDQDKFEYRLIDRLYPEEAIDQVVFNQLDSKNGIFFAPEIFENIKQLGKLTNQGKVDCKKSDAFSLGMSILRIGVMHNLQDCYDKEKYVFNRENLERHIKTF